MNPDDDDEINETVLTLEKPVPKEDDAPDDAVPARRPRWLIRSVIAVVTVTAATALVLLAIGEYQHRHTEALRTQAVATTQSYLAAMAAFDYNNLDANRDRIVGDSSPEFATKYDDMVKALRDIVVTSKGVATATAGHVVVEKIDSGTATVVAFVDQHVTNVTAPQGSEQRYRMVVTLVRSGDRWIVNDVQTV